MSGHSSDIIHADNLRVQKYVALLGVTLMSIKFVAWLATHSVSILTDAMESIVNVVAAFVGLYALYISSRPRDADHPFGHGKAELISSSVEGVMIIVAGIMIVFQSISRLIHPVPIRSLDLGLALIIVAAIANYAAGRYAIRKGEANRSMALVASGKHLCSDTYSSAGIILGLVLIRSLDALGFDVWWLDPIIASLFGIIILVTGIKVVKGSLGGVMDRMDQGMVERVLDILNRSRHDHWIDVHDLRIIKYGPTIHVEMHIVLPMDMTMVEQDREFKELNDAIKDGFGDCVDIIVMGESCCRRLCGCCEMECENRVEPFVSSIIWDLSSITDETCDHKAQCP